MEFAEPQDNGTAPLIRNLNGGGDNVRKKNRANSDPYAFKVR
jgi:hypothetical protein